MHTFLSFLVIAFGIWGIVGIIDERVDKRLHAGGVVAPTPPKPPSVFMSPRLALIGAAFGVIGLLVVIGRFA